MFSEIGSFTFDQELNRHVYYKGMEDRLYDHPLHLWLVEISMRHRVQDLPPLIEEVRASSRELDHKVWECHGNHTVILGLNETEEPWEEHHGDDLRGDEVKLELRFFEMAWEVYFTLTSDLDQSYQIVAELAEYVRERYRVGTADTHAEVRQIKDILAKANMPKAA